MTYPAGRTSAAYLPAVLLQRDSKPIKRTAVRLDSVAQARTKWQAGQRTVVAPDDVEKVTGADGESNPMTVGESK